MASFRKQYSTLHFPCALLTLHRKQSASSGDSLCEITEQKKLQHQFPLKSCDLESLPASADLEHPRRFKKLCLEAKGGLSVKYVKFGNFPHSTVRQNRSADHVTDTHSETAVENRKPPAAFPDLRWIFYWSTMHRQSQKRVGLSAQDATSGYASPWLSPFLVESVPLILTQARFLSTWKRLNLCQLHRLRNPHDQHNTHTHTPSPQCKRRTYNPL